MAINARAYITLTYLVDVKATYRYYKLQSSSSVAPEVPNTANPETGAPPSGWSDSEPSYNTVSTNTLYIIDLTVLTDNRYFYSKVSKSTAYEAAKEAWNKAHGAEQSAADAESDATDANNKVDGAIEDFDKTNKAYGATIEKLEDAINLMVFDENGGTLFTQDKNSFVMNFHDLSGKVKYIDSSIDDDGNPYTIWGSDEGFKLKVSNSGIQFLTPQGTAMGTMDEDDLLIDNIRANKELSVKYETESSKSYFTFRTRSNGNLCLDWEAL